MAKDNFHYPLLAFCMETDTVLTGIAQGCGVVDEEA